MKLSFIKILIVILILVFYGSILLHKINLPTDDLGRHIKNGEIIWQTKTVPKTNLYSYTEPDFPFLNHHWLSGLIFYFLFQLIGFKGLVIFKTIFLLAAFLLVFLIAIKRGNFWLSALASLPAIFILSERTDVRPEIFSYFFTGLFLYFLVCLADNPESKKIFWLIPFQLLWVNLHIYFFVGILTVGGYLLEKLIVERKNLKNNLVIKKLLGLFFLLILISLVNPAGYQTFLYPLKIFKNYGYEIVENKSPLFLENLMHDSAIPTFKIMVALLALSFVLALAFKKKPIFLFLISASTTVAGFLAIRNFPFFALISLPVMAINLKEALPKATAWLVIKQPKLLVVSKRILPAVMAVLFLILIFVSANDQILKNKERGLGLTFESNNSAEFFERENLAGPIFNNYDIGSYLIFHLYPKEKVFVDNRPEAYPAQFFTEIYIPMQSSEEKWQEYQKIYHFNAIFFTHQEATWWGSNFLFQRLRDSQWSLIYADSKVVILLKNRPENEQIIKKFQITKENIEQKIAYLKNSPDLKIKMAAINLFELIDRDDLALNLAQEILKENPREAQIWLEMGLIESRKNEVNNLISASHYLEKAIDLGKDLPGTYNQLGLVYFKLGWFEKAKKTWQKTLKISPKDQNAKDYLKQYQELNLP